MVRRHHRERFYDVKTRLDYQKRTEARFQALLSRARKVDDKLAVEQQLRRLREEIVSAEARLERMSKDVRLSTINVSLAEPAPVFDDGPSGPERVFRAFGRAWNALWAAVAGIIVFLGFIIPITVAIWLAYWLIWRKILRPRIIRRRETVARKDQPIKTGEGG